MTPPDRKSSPNNTESIRGLIQTGQPTRAFELAREFAGGVLSTACPEITFLAALALARGGNYGRAEKIVVELLERKLPVHVRADALSLMGRIQKDRCRTASGSAQSEFARRSFEYYLQAFKLTGKPYPGINTASMCLLAGDKAGCRTFAKRVATTLSAIEPTSDDYWTPATLGEANLLLGDIAASESAYSLALCRAAGNAGDIAAIRHQVRLLSRAIAIPSSLVTLLNGGSVVAFSGHMIDHPTRQLSGREPRFPPHVGLEQAVSEQISTHLDEIDAAVGFSSCACGGDLLFAEAMLDRQAELHVVLPFEKSDFFATSVDYGLQEMSSWRSRCERVLAKAEVHYATRENHLGDDFLFQFANRFMQGLAITRSVELCLEPIAVALADSKAVARTGGTLEFIESWKRVGRRLKLIDLEQLRDEHVVATKSEQPSSLNRGQREVRAMLFADIKGSSRLREEQTPAFFVHFLQVVADTLTAQSMRPVFKNTWGDGLFLVFEEATACADFALMLRDRIGQTDFTRFGLPADIGVRIAIHVGPVFRQADPILERDNYFGSHVNRTARIEPVTMPGCVYASEQIAAILSLEGSGRYRCEYVGASDLAKGYDRCPLYCVGR